MKDTNTISCIIPTFNGLQLLKKHLPSVVSALQDGDQVIISDDASTDETVGWLTKRYDLKKVDASHSGTLYQGMYLEKNKKLVVTLLVNQSNLRFAESVNQAVKLCTNSYFFLVNNDVSVEKNAITLLRQQIQSDESIFAIGCLEYEQDKSGSKSGKNKLWFERGLFQHSKADNFNSGSTAWASGGSAMFSTAKWHELAGFDPAFYPAYWEDIDISYRARNKGWRVLFNQDAVVYHKHESTNKSVFGLQAVSEMSWKNAFVFTWKHANFYQKLQFLSWYPYWQWQQLKSAK